MLFGLFLSAEAEDENARMCCSVQDLRTWTRQGSHSKGNMYRNQRLQLSIKVAMLCCAPCPKWSSHGKLRWLLVLTLPAEDGAFLERASDIPPQACLNHSTEQSSGNTR